MRLGITLATGLVACMLAVAPAYAHGEKSQMAFLRMRTINWYDLHWSKTEVNVGDVVEITGKFNVFGLAGCSCESTHGVPEQWSAGPGVRA